MAFSLLGRTPSEASAQQGEWTRYYTGQANANEANRVQAILQSMRAQEAEDRFGEEQRQFDVGRSLAAANALREEAFARGRDLENTRRFEIEQANKLHGEQQDQLWKWKAQYPLIQSEIAKNRAYQAPGESQEDIYLMKTISEMAGRGEIDNPAQVRRLFPKLTPALAELIATRSATNRREEEADFEQLVNAARLATEYEKARRQLVAANAMPDVTDFWHRGTPGTDRKNAIEKANQRISELSEAYNRIKDPKAGIMQLLKFNEATGEYLPGVPAPRSVRRQTVASVSLPTRTVDTGAATSEVAPLVNPSTWRVLGAQLLSPRGVAGAYPEVESLPALPFQPRTQTASTPAPVLSAETPTFNSEAEARAAGYGSNSLVRIVGVGKVRLR